VDLERHLEGICSLEHRALVWRSDWRGLWMGVLHGIGICNIPTIKRK
jgi:hypothetical protein